MMQREASLNKAVEEAKKIRRSLLRSNFMVWPRDLCGACGIASILLSISLDDVRTLRFKPGHAWNQIGRTIIDITATQFNHNREGERVRGVLVTNTPRTYHEGGLLLKGRDAYIALIGWYDSRDHYQWNKIETYWIKKK